MPKVVINRCFGGFGLSHEAIMRYGEIKGLMLYPEKREFDFVTYWTVPPEERPATLDGDAFYAASMEERKTSNEAHSAATIYDRDIERVDPALVQVVEEMGATANGRFADLAVVDVPDNASWHIHEYDGLEHVAEDHRTWG